LKGAKLARNTEQIRSFIAIELPGEVKGQLAELRRDLERTEHRFVKWVEPEGIHLTLKFLGNIPLKQVTEITKAMEEAARDIPPFHLEFSGVGAFPNLKQPNVLWVGIGGEIDTLLRLQQNIDSELASLDFAKEERPFMPHLTLARVRQGTSPMERRQFGELAMFARFGASYPVDVKAISLMRSQLTPDGAIYTRLSMVGLEVKKN
jgi:2'-5' RNA ligase